MLRITSALMSGHTHLPIPLPQNKIIIILEMFKDKWNKLVKKSNWLEKFINSALCQATTTPPIPFAPLPPQKKTSSKIS